MITNNKTLSEWENIPVLGSSVIIKNIDKKKEFYVYLSEADEVPSSNIIGYPIEIGERLEYVTDGRYLFVRGNPKTDVSIT